MTEHFTNVSDNHAGFSYTWKKQVMCIFSTMLLNWHGELSGKYVPMDTKIQQYELYRQTNAKQEIGI